MNGAVNHCGPLRHSLRQFVSRVKDTPATATHADVFDRLSVVSVRPSACELARESRNFRLTGAAMTTSHGGGN